jgi:hypothetical protein
MPRTVQHENTSYCTEYASNASKILAVPDVAEFLNELKTGHWGASERYCALFKFYSIPWNDAKEDAADAIIPLSMTDHMGIPIGKILIRRDLIGVYMKPHNGKIMVVMVDKTCHARIGLCTEKKWVEFLDKTHPEGVINLPFDLWFHGVVSNNRKVIVVSGITSVETTPVDEFKHRANVYRLGGSGVESGDQKDGKTTQSPPVQSLTVQPTASMNNGSAAAAAVASSPRPNNKRKMMDTCK